MNRVTMMLAAGLVFLAAASLPIMRAGALQAVVTEDNLDQTIASAKTPADHEAIAAFYEQEAVDAKKKAGIHRRTAETYRSLKIPKPVYMAEMCDGIAAMWDKIAADNSKLAGQEISDGQGGRVTALLVHQSFLGLQACAGCG